jgi:hypothetical protein
MTPDGQDLYLILERAVRTPKERLLVDAFLPPAEAIPSAVQPPAPPRAADPAPGTGSDDDLLVRRPDAEETPEPPPPPRRRTKKSAGPQKSLEEEIAEFMSRGAALAPDPDPEP